MGQGTAQKITETTDHVHCAPGQDSAVLFDHRGLSALSALYSDCQAGVYAKNKHNHLRSQRGIQGECV